MLLASTSPLWGIVVALIALAGVVVGQVAVGLRGSRDRRRNEYSAAFAAALAWCELPYKVARRLSNNHEDVAPIIEAFHKAQTDLFFHRMWLRSVSSETAQSYERLVNAIQSQTQPHSNAAWERAPWDPGSGPLGSIFQVDVDAQQAEFSEAVQRDLSVWKRLTAPLRTTRRGTSYDSRFRRLYGRKPFTAYLGGCLAVAGLVADHHLWLAFAVVIVAAAAPSGLAVKDMPARQRSTWLTATALVFACLFALAAVFGIVAALLGLGVLAVTIVAPDAVIDRDKQQQGRHAKPGLPSGDQEDGQHDHQQCVQQAERS